MTGKINKRSEWWLDLRCGDEDKGFSLWCRVSSLGFEVQNHPKNDGQALVVTWWHPKLQMQM